MLEQISKTTVVCSKHFTKEDYTGWTPLKRKLKKIAVPTVFQWTDDKAPRIILKRPLPTPHGPNPKRLLLILILSIYIVYIFYLSSSQNYIRHI